jgi:hypothetical protein
MGVPTSEVGYTSVTAERRDHEVRKGHVVASENIYIKVQFVPRSKHFVLIKNQPVNSKHERNKIVIIAL